MGFRPRACVAVGEGPHPLRRLCGAGTSPKGEETRDLRSFVFLFPSAVVRGKYPRRASGVGDGGLAYA